MTLSLKTVLILVLLALGTGLYLGWRLAGSPPQNPPHIKIVKQVVTKTEYIKVPVSESGLKECYESPIRIKAEIDDNTMNIEAYDNCKKAEAFVALDVYRRWPEPHDVLVPLGALFAGILLVGLL